MLIVQINSVGTHEQVGQVFALGVAWVERVVGCRSSTS